MLLALQGNEASSGNSRTFWKFSLTPETNMKYQENLILSIKICTCGSFSCLFTKAFTFTPLWTDAERCSTFYRNKKRKKKFPEASHSIKQVEVTITSVSPLSFEPLWLMLLLRWRVGAASCPLHRELPGHMVQPRDLGRQSSSQLLPRAGFERSSSLMLGAYASGLDTYCLQL